MSQNHFNLMCLQAQYLVLESATPSVRISNTRSCAALWAVDLGSLRQDTFQAGTFEGFPTSPSRLKKKTYQWSQQGKINQKDYQNIGNVTKHFVNMFYRFAKVFKCLQRNRRFHKTSPN